MRSWLHLLALLALLRAEAGEQPSAGFPFEFRERLIRVKVTVPSSEQQLNFLVDSGAQVSVLSLRTARRLGLRLGRRVPVRGVHTVTEGYWPQRTSASLGDLALPREFLVMDLEQLSKVCCTEVDGLVGADFFRDRIVQIDFKAERIRVLDEFVNPLDAEVLPLKLQRSGMLVPVGVNTQAPRWFRLDTGCASALQWVASETPSSRSQRQMAVGLTPIEIPMTQTSVRLGAARFDEVPTGLHGKAIFGGEAGLLGNGLLSRFDTVTIDAKEGRLILEHGAVTR